jgi:hypothetical protein
MGKRLLKRHTRQVVRAKENRRNDSQAHHAMPAIRKNSGSAAHSAAKVEV